MPAGGGWGRADGEDGRWVQWRSVRGCQNVTPGIGKGPCGDLMGTFVCRRVGRCGGDLKGMRKWGADSLPSTSRVGAPILQFFSAKLHGDLREPSALEFGSPSPSLMLSFGEHWE